MTLNSRLNLGSSKASVCRYLKRLGWRSIRTKFCQAVSWKNRLERQIYANMCVLYKEQFYNTIFIDESTIQVNKNGRFKVMPHENAFGLVGKYKSPAKASSLGLVFI